MLIEGSNVFIFHCVDILKYLKTHFTLFKCGTSYIPNSNLYLKWKMKQGRWLTTIRTED